QLRRVRDFQLLTPRPEPFPQGGRETWRFAVMAHPRIRHLLVAGGAGFLGAAFVRDRPRADPEILITGRDARRHPAAAGDLADLVEDRRFRLVRGDVCDRSLVEDLAGKADAIVNFASEEFVGGTSADAPAFARTDVQGTANLLEAARKFRHQRFLLASSMEVYGPVKGAPNREDDAMDPRTLAAAARAAAGMLARAYQVSHGLPVLITRGVPSYGPRQPLDQPVAGMIAAALQGLPVAVDADGSAARNYLFVDDQVGAVARVLWKGEPGTTYNIGGGLQVSGSDLADMILRLCRRAPSLKRFLKDAPRWLYAIDTRRMRPLGWEPRTTLSEGLRLTVDWYRTNESWSREGQVD